MVVVDSVRSWAVHAASMVCKMWTIDVLLCVTFLLPALAQENRTTLRIIHTNDMHARYSQSPIPEEICTSDKKCYGGFSRIVTAVQQERSKAEDENVPIVFLNGGDTYQKTLWHTLFKWKIALEMTNLLKLDAMALGNHEFDERPEGLVPFLNEVNCPVVACNVGFEEEPELFKTPVQKSVVLDVNGTKIGVIGYITPDTKFKSQTGRVKFYDEVASIAEEAKKLKEQGIKILVALGHSGYKVDQRIAKLVPDIDVVVGAHSHTFLYTGKRPDVEVPEGPYPTMIKQETGRLVAVVQAFAFTKYLGKLDVVFDSDGEVVKAGGSPILMDSTIPEDESVLEVLEKWKEEYDNVTGTVIGTSRVYLDSGACQLEECSMGNLVADALQYYVALTSSSKGWTDAAVALVNAGSLRSSINVTGDGSVTAGDIYRVLIYRNRIHLVNLQGKYLRQALEHSAAGPGTQFLQMSGMKVVYNMLQPVGSRVSEVEVMCSDCDVPRYQPLDDNQHYNVIVSGYLANGGNGYKQFREHGVVVDTLDKLDADVVIQYISDIELVYHGVSGRITTVQ